MRSRFVDSINKIPRDYIRKNDSVLTAEAVRRHWVSQFDRNVGSETKRKLFGLLRDNFIKEGPIRGYPMLDDKSLAGGDVLLVSIMTGGYWFSAAIAEHLKKEIPFEVVFVGYHNPSRDRGNQNVYLDGKRMA